MPARSKIACRRTYERIEGRSVRFRALVADEHGDYELPVWAQPFARLGVSLLGRSLAKSPRELVDAFVSGAPPRLVSEAAVLATNRGDHPLLPQTVDTAVRAAVDQRLASMPAAKQSPIVTVPDGLFRRLTDSLLIDRASDGAWRFVPGVQPLLAQIVADRPLLGREILWIGDVRTDYQKEVVGIRRLGADVHETATVEDTFTVLAGVSPDVIVSAGIWVDPDAEVELIARLRNASVSAPIVFRADTLKGSDGESGRALL